MKIAYKTKNGLFYEGRVEEVLGSKRMDKYKGKIDLIFTSPPFPLLRKKNYGNFQGQEYVNWLKSLGPIFSEYLSEKGSLVMEIGNSWEERLPVMSTLTLESLLAFLKESKLYLCQQFVWFNPAKLPSPAQWVTIERNRVKDSFTHIWWMSKTPYPKADNRKVLEEYSKSMKRLLKNKKYNAGVRPSEHSISEASFFNDNDGAIPANVLFSSNTVANSQYQLYCKEHRINPHPARMPIDIANFFIKFLTEPGDLVLDPFGGSNTTGEAAETLERKWISIESNSDYILGSKGRFTKILNDTNKPRRRKTPTNA